MLHRGKILATVCIEALAIARTLFIEEAYRAAFFVFFFALVLALVLEEALVVLEDFFAVGVAWCARDCFALIFDREPEAFERCDEAVPPALSPTLAPA